MRFTDESQAVDYIYQSIRTRTIARGLDENTRNTTPTARLLGAAGLITPGVEFAVITGSIGKGSTAAMLAKILQSLDHPVGLITSPYFVSQREQIRFNGRSIPSADFLRILDMLAPQIDAIEAALESNWYFSPHGIFLAIGLQWFNEQGARAVVIEAVRGGRYDDMGVVPNNLSLFTPIMLEHTQELGDTLERIAWHMAGVIDPATYAYSVPQASEVLDVLSREAEAREAEFAWIPPMDMGAYLVPTTAGLRMELGRYGEIELPLLDRRQVINASLAVQGAGNMHARLGGLPHGSTEYVERVRQGLETLRWPGRLQKLQDSPAVYVDGATTVSSVRSCLNSLRGRLPSPLICVAAIPVDRDYPSVYTLLGSESSGLIVSECDCADIRFPDPQVALDAARHANHNALYIATLSDAVQSAIQQAGPTGSVLIVGALPAVGEVLTHWGFTFEQI